MRNFSHRKPNQDLLDNTGCLKSHQDTAIQLKAGGESISCFRHYGFCVLAYSSNYNIIDLLTWGGGGGSVYIPYVVGNSGTL